MPGIAIFGVEMEVDVGEAMGFEWGIQIAHHRVGRFQRKFHLEEVCSRYLIFRTSDLLAIEKLQQRRLITSRRMKSSLTSRV